MNGVSFVIALAKTQGSEESDASDHPCNEDEIRLSDGHHADKEQEAC